MKQWHLLAYSKLKAQEYLHYECKHIVQLQNTILHFLWTRIPKDKIRQTKYYHHNTDENMITNDKGKHFLCFKMKVTYFVELFVYGV